VSGNGSEVDRRGWPGLFTSAFRQSRNAMVLLDSHRRHIDANGAYVRMLGYPRDEILGVPASQFVAGGPLMTDDEWEVMLDGGPFTGEAGLVTADGTVVAVQWGVTPEAITGHRLVLFVALTTSRWGRHFRRPIDIEEASAPLSAREREVVHLIAMGSTGPEIADELHISHDTVRTHVRNAMAKIGARSRAHLVARALGDGHILG
jgi:PAS domain S-box-containing protein